MKLNEYITKDISEKKVLLEVYPKNTDDREEKFKEIVNEIKNKYENIKVQLGNFINYKYDKLLPIKNEKDINDLLETKDKLIKFFKYLNKDNSFYEKNEIDIYFYKLMQYYDNSIEENDDLIKKLLDFFALSGVKLSDEDFKLNIFENYYMSKFFDKTLDKKQLEDEHLKIYWKYPKIFETIIISFNRLIYLNEKRIEEFSNTKRREELVNNKISNIDDLKALYKNNYTAIEKVTTFYEADIINNCLDDEIDYQLLSFTKETLEEIFDKLLINKIDLSNEEQTNKTVVSIIKLNRTLDEYKKFKENENIFKYFQTTFNEYVSEENNLKEIKSLEKEK